MKQFFLGQEVRIDHQDGDIGSYVGRGHILPGITLGTPEKPSPPVVKYGFARVKLPDGTVRGFPKESLKGIL